jgi:hypothetical protein
MLQWLLTLLGQKDRPSKQIWSQERNKVSIRLTIDAGFIDAAGIVIDVQEVLRSAGLKVISCEGKNG